MIGYDCSGVSLNILREVHENAYLLSGLIKNILPCYFVCSVLLCDSLGFILTPSLAFQSWLSH